MNLARPQSAGRGGTTRNELKRAARRLFAERGIAAVGMREIVEAAGQRNAAAVHYYFGSKDDLLRELVVEGADLIDTTRMRMIDEAEAQGDLTLRDVVRALVIPNAELAGETGEGETYFRFMTSMQTERRQMFDQWAGGEHSAGYVRCLAHFHRLLADLPHALVNQRLLFAGLSLRTLLAGRETARDAGAGADHPYWGEPVALAGMIDAVEAILLGPAKRG
ncbi:TetR/AcrR family transcriptional regulator [Sphingomonas jeddahensis]|uniref:Putative DNA-binding transcriptional regulator n=1 Tax=Sphingomonas jeddahensis TaxID=1915074 RepID=A0A1V2EX38_9SPHN|nr:TetR/AcrR family transcriptional regulator [Sphingomonas jeddahensis]ONF96858.1 putative DNA-binding transcriptional regulator [Sphingomonas jeddahensis]